MRTFPTLLRPLLNGWSSSLHTHPALDRIDFHYHDVEEWLEVQRGAMTFFTLSGQAFPLEKGGVLHIPRGEVHRADIGPAGVDYQMYLPVEVTPAFSNRLSAEEIDLLRTNLESPVHEENTDGHAAEFFDSHLSDQLVFYRADGSLVGKEAFRAGFTPRGRSSAGTVSVLNRSATSLLLSMLVHVGAAGPAQKHFTNIRVFAKEGAAWKCRIWVNTPEAG